MFWLPAPLGAAASSTYLPTYLPGCDLFFTARSLNSSMHTYIHTYIHACMHRGHVGDISAGTAGCSAFGRPTSCCSFLEDQSSGGGWR